MPSWALFLLTTLLLKYRYHHTPKRFESLLGRRRGEVQACSVEYEKSRQKGSSINWRTTVKLTWIIIIQERNHLSQRCFVDATKRMRRFGYLPLFGGWTFSPQVPYNQILWKSLIRLHYVSPPTYPTLCSPLMQSAVVFEATKQTARGCLSSTRLHIGELRSRRLRALARRGRSSLRVNRTPWGMLWA